MVTIKVTNEKCGMDIVYSLNFLAIKTYEKNRSAVHSRLKVRSIFDRTLGIYLFFSFSSQNMRLQCAKERSAYEKFKSTTSPLSKSALSDIAFFPKSIHHRWLFSFYWIAGPNKFCKDRSFRDRKVNCQHCPNFWTADFLLLPRIEPKYWTTATQSTIHRTNLTHILHPESLLRYW